MIDKRNTTFIDKDRFIYMCIKCGLKFSDTIRESKECPNCKGELVINKNLLVLK